MKTHYQRKFAREFVIVAIGLCAAILVVLLTINITPRNTMVVFAAGGCFLPFFAIARGEYLRRTLRSSRNSTCRRCGYDLVDIGQESGKICPECGKEFDPDEPLL